MTTTASTAVVVYDPGLVDPEHVALAGYRGLTRDADAHDLRQFVASRQSRQLGLFEVRRSDIKTFGPELEAKGRATATIARRSCRVTGFYRYAEEEGPIAHSCVLRHHHHAATTLTANPRLLRDEGKWDGWSRVRPPTSRASGPADSYRARRSVAANNGARRLSTLSVAS